jgi:hypothetical protein
MLNSLTHARGFDADPTRSGPKVNAALALIERMAG